MNLSTVSSPQNNNLPNQSFSRWLRSQIDVLIGNTLGLMSTGYLIFALAYYSAPKNTEGLGKYLTSNNIQYIIYWLHLVFITYCIAKLVSIFYDNKVGFYRTKLTYRRLFGNDPTDEMFEECREVIKNFKAILICFWVSMFFLYTSFLFTTKWETVSNEKERLYSITLESKSNIVDAISDQGGVEQSYSRTFEGRDPITARENPQDKTKQLRPTKDFRQAFGHIASKFFVYSMNTLSLMFVFWCFVILYRPPIDERKIPPKSEKPVNDKRIHNQKKLFGYSLIATVILIAAFPLFFHFAADKEIYTDTRLTDYVVFFDAISGVLNGVALALLIARLDSKLVGLPSWLVGILYFYAAVQPLFVVFELPGVVSSTIKTFVLIAVFTLKIYFFFIILYAFQTGRILNYILCFPTFNTKVDSIFQNQFEIYIAQEKKSEFRFLITRRNKVIFTTDSRFRTRDECEEAIGRLLEAANEDDSYLGPKPKENGTYVVEIWPKDDPKLWCISIDLKSKEEGEELIEESIEKLPFCKFDYNRPRT